MEIAEACLIAGINAKANAQLLVIPRMESTDTTELSGARRRRDHGCRRHRRSVRDDVR